MKILVANLGSTSFKYRLFDMDAGRQLARGGVERIGSPESPATVEIGDFRQQRTLHAADHVEAVHHCLAQLTDRVAISSIGFAILVLSIGPNGSLSR